MASPYVHTNGFGGTAGATLATLSPVLTSGVVWYVHSGTGTDAVSPRGKERLRPLATIGQAHTNASNNDVIVFLSGHSETITGTQTLSKTGISYLGEGTGTSRPTFVRNVDANGFVFSGAGCLIENLLFDNDGAAAATTGDRVVVSGASCSVVNCYFRVSSTALVTSGALVVSGNNCTISGGTQFINAGSTNTIGALSVGNVSDLTLDDVTFDGGTSGWGSGVVAATLGTITRLKARNVDLLNGSDMTIATSSFGTLHVRNRTGASQVTWTA